MTKLSNNLFGISHMDLNDKSFQIFITKYFQFIMPCMDIPGGVTKFFTPLCLLNGKTHRGIGRNRGASAPPPSQTCNSFLPLWKN